MRRGATLYLLGVMGLSLVLALVSIARVAAGVIERVAFDPGSFWAFTVRGRTEILAVDGGRGVALVGWAVIGAAAIALYALHRTRLTAALRADAQDARSLYVGYLQLVAAVLAVGTVLAAVVALLGLIVVFIDPSPPGAGPGPLVLDGPASLPAMDTLEAARARFIGGAVHALLLGAALVLHRRRFRGLEAAEATS
jgi:hypothetical protein